MSKDKNVQGSDFSYRHEKNGNNRIFHVARVLLTGVILFTITTYLSKEGRTLEVNRDEVVVYGDALEMQYARPWIDRDEAAASPAVPFSDALAMQYAQPWRDAVPVVYGDALAMQYAQPWLKAEVTKSCFGRLDMIYACQNGYR